MISKRSASSLSLMVVLAALLGCKLFGENPKKVCARLDALKDKEGVSDSDPELCEQRLARAKKNNREAFECMAKCVESAESSTGAESCWQQSCASVSGGESESESASETESSDDKLTRMAIDRLDDSRVKDAISSANTYYGYEYISERSTAGGWSLQFMLGKKGVEAQVYRVLLLDVKSAAEAKALASVFSEKRSYKDVHWRAGDKKLLFVECIGAVNRSVGKYDATACGPDDRGDSVLRELSRFRG